jgi:Patatin-like phospholipase
MSTMRTLRKLVVAELLWAGRAIVLACALLSVGCASSVAIKVARAGAETPCLVQMPDRDLLVGVAMSGGGSRAALFGAAGLEELAKIPTPGGGSVLEQVSYISSVSGGSIASSYYVLNKPSREVAGLAPDGSMSAEYRAFFDRYQSLLSQDFETPLIWRQLGSFRWLNSALAARSLSEILAEKLYGDARMQDISQREARQDSPGLIINTTLYNNGRRLAVTTLPPGALHYDFFEAFRESLARRGQPARIPPRLEERWATLLPMSPLEIHMDPCLIRVSGAVTASASFPPVIGPITMQVAGEETYWHAGDGGLYENSGFESLVFLFLKRLQEKTTRRALILAFDSSFPFAVGDRQLSRRAEPFSLLTFDFSRVPSIMEERASTYQALFFRSLQIEGVFPDSNTIQVIPLRHLDAQWKDDLSDLPPACRDDKGLRSPADVMERIAEIPTRLVLKSDCDRQLLATAAAKVVSEHRQEILDFLEGRIQ